MNFDWPFRTGGNIGSTAWSLLRIPAPATFVHPCTAKTPYRDGTTDVVFEPLDFMARLAALVPTPRVNLTRYHGAINMDWRAESPAAKTSDAGQARPAHDRG